MAIHLIAAVAENRVIGRDGGLPWHIPADLKHFKALTTGHTVIMGRRTYESIGKPLPNRRNIVVSRTMTQPPTEGVELAASLEEALARASQEECFIIGGAQLYAEALPRAQWLHLTRVHAEVEGDVLFPEVDWSQWIPEQKIPGSDEKATVPFTFWTYRRKGFNPR